MGLVAEFVLRTVGALHYPLQIESAETPAESADPYIGGQDLSAWELWMEKNTIHTDFGLAEVAEAGTAAAFAAAGVAVAASGMATVAADVAGSMVVAAVE
jgi:hypothetical protein